MFFYIRFEREKMNYKVINRCYIKFEEANDIE